MPYYHDIITEQSWQELKKLSQRVDIVLIGGWAVYLYARAMKSKDIDIIIDFDQLPILEKYYEMNKNDRLKKYEAVKGPVQIDIYLPHYSKLGIPVEKLEKQVQEVDGFRVLDIDYLLALKIYTLSKRGRSVKGIKDFIDVMALARSKSVNLAEVKLIIGKFELKESIQFLMTMLTERQSIPEMDINHHDYARLKREMVKLLEDGGG